MSKKDMPVDRRNLLVYIVHMTTTRFNAFGIERVRDPRTDVNDSAGLTDRAFELLCRYARERPDDPLTRETFALLGEAVSARELPGSKTALRSA